MKTKPSTWLCTIAALMTWAALSAVLDETHAQTRSQAQTQSEPRTQPRPQTTPTLDEITIEGEIAMPQVLFITAREPFRYPDTRHQDYLPTAAMHAAGIPFPTSLWILGHERPSTLEAPSPLTVPPRDNGTNESDEGILDQG